MDTFNVHTVTDETEMLNSSLAVWDVWRVDVALELSGSFR